MTSLESGSPANEEISNDSIRDSLLQQSPEDFEDLLKYASLTPYEQKLETNQNPEKLVQQMLKEEKTNAKKKVAPFGVNYPGLQFIDHQEVDMERESKLPFLNHTVRDEVKKTKVQRARCGNQEVKLTEMNDDFNSMERGEITSNVRISEYDLNEYFDGTTELGKNETVLSPSSNGLPCSLQNRRPVHSDLSAQTKFVDGSKEDRVPQFPQRKTEEPIVFSSADAIKESDRTAEFTNLIQKTTENNNDNGKKKLRAKKKTAIEKTYIVPGDPTADTRSVDEILKQYFADEQQPEAPAKPKKEKRRKSKDQVKQKEKDEVTDKKMITTSSDKEEKAANVENLKRSSTASGLDDGDEVYVSADEEMGSNTQLVTPPTEFVDAKPVFPTKVKQESLLLDAENYRRDDEDIATIAQQIDEKEEEFITVGKNKKKHTVDKKHMSNEEVRHSPITNRRGPASSTATTAHSTNGDDNQSQSSTGQQQNSRRYSVPHGNNDRQSQQQQQQQVSPAQQGQGGRRPGAPLLADYFEGTKKDTHKAPKFKPRKSTHQQQFSPTAEDFVDASDAPFSIDTDPALSANAPPPQVSPERGFSYADAAKRSAENSGTVSPVMQNHNSPSSDATSPTSNESVSGVQMMPGTRPSPRALNDISFGFEDNITVTQTPPPAPTVPAGAHVDFKINGKTVKISHLAPAPRGPMKFVNSEHKRIYTELTNIWQTFQSGTPPTKYVPVGGDRQ